MNKSRSSTLGAFTLIELIVILGIIVLVAFVLTSKVAEGYQKAKRIRCVSHLKQIGMSFRLWSGDNTNAFPMARSTNFGGTLEVANDVWRTFQVMSNELSTPLILACPSDTQKLTSNFSTLSNSNISYFVSLDAHENMPELLLAGDRHLSVGRSTLSKVLTIHTNDLVRWTGQTHREGGNIALADGSVQQKSIHKLRESVTNALQGHWEKRTNATLRLAMPE
jgi:prepilin-type processing-associated H-X9-DG protein